MPLLSNGAVDKWRLEHGTLWRLLGLWGVMISRVFEAMIKHVEVCGGLILGILGLEVVILLFEPL